MAPAHPHRIGVTALGGLVVACWGCTHVAPHREPPQPSAALEPPAAAAIAPPSVPSRVIRILRPKGEEPSPIFSVQVDTNRVYFNDGTGRLWAAPKDGSSPATRLVDDPHDSVRSFVVDGETIYYAAREAIRSVPTRGGPSIRWADNRSGPILLVSDRQHIYHTVFDGSATYRMSLATHREERFCGGGKHQTLAVDDANLYIASYFTGTITATSKKTRRAHVLVTGVRRPVRLTIDDEFVYFTSEADGSVRRVSKRGGRSEILARGQRGQEHLALDESHVYWATRTAQGTFAVMRAPIVAVHGGMPEALYVGLRSVGGLAVDDRFVYVADRGAGEVVRLVKDQPAQR